MIKPVAAGFAAGLSVALLWHGYVMRGVELQRAAQVTAGQQTVIEYRDRESVENNDNIKDYQESINDYRKKLDDMRRSSDIAIRVCKADAAVRAVKADNSAALAAGAESDNARLREDILSVLEKSKKADAWAESAFEFINRP